MLLTRLFLMAVECLSSRIPTEFSDNPLQPVPLIMIPYTQLLFHKPRLKYKQDFGLFLFCCLYNNASLQWFVTVIVTNIYLFSILCCIFKIIVTVLRQAQHRMQYQRSSVRGHHSTKTFKLTRGITPKLKLSELCPLPCISCCHDEQVYQI